MVSNEIQNVIQNLGTRVCTVAVFEYDFLLGSVEFCFNIFSIYCDPGNRDEKIWELTHLTWLPFPSVFILRILPSLVFSSLVPTCPSGYGPSPRLLPIFPVVDAFKAKKKKCHHQQVVDDGILFFFVCDFNLLCWFEVLLLVAFVVVCVCWSVRLDVSSFGWCCFLHLGHSSFFINLFFQHINFFWKFSHHSVVREFPKKK